MKKAFTAAVLLLLACQLWGQTSPGYRVYFEEAKSAAEKSYALWERELYGPILLIDTVTRAVYANVPDEEGHLEKYGSIYTGIYPDDRVYANTAINWGGVDWAMVMLPLPVNKYDRVSLMIHERFHVLQPGLGFSASSSYNKHLNEKQGRIYLRLELEALKAAVSSKTGSDMTHVRNALVFRIYRHSIYPSGAESENGLELNEGLAEYTGEAACGRPEREKSKHFTNNIENFLNSPSFVRSFAYQTIPVYGYLLDRIDKGWNRKVTEETDLTSFFIESFGMAAPADIDEAVAQISGRYGFKDIALQESERERSVKEREQRYYEHFVEDQRLVIKLENMQIQFDPRNIIPIDGYGTVYPFMNLVDNWGVLKVTEGAMINETWTEVIVSAPQSIKGRIITGKGWLLELVEGYRLEKDSVTGDFSIVKQIID